MEKNMIQIRLYGEQHQQRLVELKDAYDAPTLTKMLERLIDAAYEQLDSRGGTNIYDHQH